MVRYGDLDDRYLRLGADFHYLEQGLRENYDITNTVPPSIGPFFTNQPFQHDAAMKACSPNTAFRWSTAGLSRSAGASIGSKPNALLRDVRPDTNLDRRTS